MDIIKEYFEYAINNGYKYTSIENEYIFNKLYYNKFGFLYCQFLDKSGQKINIDVIKILTSKEFLKRIIKCYNNLLNNVFKSNDNEYLITEFAKIQSIAILENKLHTFIYNLIYENKISLN